MGNTCRSPMAAALLRLWCGDAVVVESAGVAAGRRPAAEHAVTILAERGVDLRGHRSRHIDSVELDRFDTVVAMDSTIASDLEGRGVAPERLVVLSVPDPIGGSAADYRATLASIEEQMAEAPRLRAFRGDAT